MLSLSKQNIFLTFIQKCILIIFLFSFSSCEEERKNNNQENKEEKSYLYLAHTYAGGSMVDPRLEKLNRSSFDQIWLGGDICGETTENSLTPLYLDILFDLSNSGNFWSLGNHDVRNGNVQWITNRTKRPTFYTSNINGITAMVWNTNLNIGGPNCERIKAQFEMINNVCDTISASSHLIVLAHQVMWGELNSMIPTLNYANADGSFQYYNCKPDQLFATAVYPKLVEVQKRGVDVIIVAGDMGQKTFSFETTTPEGIQLLASGIISDIEWNKQFPTYGTPTKVLIFKHHPEKRTLTWSFELLDNLY